MDMNELKKEARETAQAALKASIGEVLAGFEGFFDDKDVPDNLKMRVLAPLQQLFTNLGTAAFARDVSGIAGAFSAGRPADRVAMVTGDTFHAPVAAPAATLGALSSAPTVSDAQYAQLDQAATALSTTVDALIANLPAYIQAAEQAQAQLVRERDEAQRKLAEEHDPAIVGSLAQQLAAVSASEAAATADLASAQSELASTQTTLASVRAMHTELDTMLQDVYAAFRINPMDATDGPSLVAALESVITSPADPGLTARAQAYDEIIAAAAHQGVRRTRGMNPEQIVQALVDSGAARSSGGTLDPSSPHFTSAKALIESFFHGRAPAIGGGKWLVSRPDENVLKAAQQAVGLPPTGFVAPPMTPTPPPGTPAPAPTRAP